MPTFSNILNVFDINRPNICILDSIWQTAAIRARYAAPKLKRKNVIQYSSHPLGRGSITPVTHRELDRLGHALKQRSEKLGRVLLRAHTKHFANLFDIVTERVGPRRPIARAKYIAYYLLDLAHRAKAFELLEFACGRVRFAY